MSIDRTATTVVGEISESISLWSLSTSHFLRLLVSSSIMWNEIKAVPQYSSTYSKELISINLSKICWEETTKNYTEIPVFATKKSTVDMVNLNLASFNQFEYHGFHELNIEMSND